MRLFHIYIYKDLISFILDIMRFTNEMTVRTVLYIVSLKTGLQINCLSTVE
jgi:hypothetical protein